MNLQREGLWCFQFYSPTPRTSRDQILQWSIHSALYSHTPSLLHSYRTHLLKVFFTSCIGTKTKGESGNISFLWGLARGSILYKHFLQRNEMNRTPSVDINGYSDRMIPMLAFPGIFSISGSLSISKPVIFLAGILGSCSICTQISLWAASGIRQELVHALSGNTCFQWPNVPQSELILEITKVLSGESKHLAPGSLATKLVAANVAWGWSSHATFSTLQCNLHFC